MICCRCFGFRSGFFNAKGYDLLLLLWFRSGGRILRRTISSLLSFSKWCSNAKMYDLLTVALVPKWCLNAKMYDLLPLLWSLSWCPNIEMYDLLPFEVVQCYDVRFVAVALVCQC